MGSSCICSTKNPITTQNQLDPKLITLNSKTSKHFRTSIYISNRENIHKRYITKETIGQGFFSKVKLVESKTDPPKNYVVKTISKDTLSLKELHSLIREIQLLSQLDHPNIIKYYETYDDENEFHIIMNHCTGGELFDKLQNEGPLPEHECAAIIYQILHAISHCHSRGIVHRDIKAENILFNDKAHNKINIIDFGLSKKTKNDNGNMHTFVGTTLYLSPEVISGKYDEKCDLWSIGVLLYFMLYGKYPFDDENGEKEKIFHKIKHEEPDYDIPESCVSRSAKNLIQKLLKKKPKHRYTAQEALNDPWFIKHITNNIHITALNLPKLQSRIQPTTFIKKIFGFIIKEIDSEQIENLRKQFYLLDDDKTGVINLKKYSSSLSKKSKGESIEEGSCAKQTNNGANTNSIPINHCGTFNETVSNSNELDYTSFVITSLKNKNLLTQTIFRNVFNRLDNDGKGVLNLNGINKAFRRIGKKLSNDMLQKMVIESGFENADNITFDNFVKPHLRMQTCLFSGDAISQISESFEFHDPIEKVYEAYTNIAVISSIFKNQFTLVSLKHSTTLDDEGNEFTINIANQYSFTFLVENCHKTPTYHYTFTLRCIFYPSFFCSFFISLNFYWDTLAELTLFHGEITFDDSRYSDSTYMTIKNNFHFPNKEIQEYLKQTIKNLEETESISINANLECVWNFISNVKNLNYFFPFKNIEINTFNNDSLITIFDPSSKNEMKLNRTQIINETKTKMGIKLEIFSSIIPVPKQLIIIDAIQIKNDVTLVMFKHIVLEYILYDVLKSSSNNKQKILKRIKKQIELNVSLINNSDVNNSSMNGSDAIDNSQK